uniref:Ribonuclease H-like domain-containing protein n=1 Tax=Tanacetum cinerariifolium TaxID=118510 RepID=A0A699GIP8_TANCI|nr:ribonuclease H-like domain-containing protein [Tanacetum cinerariifolium]
MAGSDNESDDASVHNEATNTQQQPNIQPQIITTVSNNNAKFPYLKKDESKRESKARTTLLQSIPVDYVANFHYMDDARDIWNEVKARFGGNAESKKMRKSMLKQEFLEFRIGEVEGLHKGYDRMQKILSQLNQLKANPNDKDINLKFLRALPSSWSQVALTLKTKCRLELLSFGDLYYKLKTLKVDVKGYNTFSSSQSAGPSHYAFVSATSTSKKMSYGDSLNYSSTTTYSIPSNSKTGSHRSGNVIEDVLQSFVVDTELEQQLAYEDLGQIEKLDVEEMDLKWQMAMLSIRVHKFKQKAGKKIDFDKKESVRFNKKKTDHDTESDGVITTKEFGMIAGCDNKDAIDADDAGEFALMGVTSETKLDNHLVQTEKWKNSSKNLFRLIDSSMSVRTKVGRPIFHRFAETNSMKVVPPPLSGDYPSLSDHTDLDESQMSYGTKSLTSSDSQSVSNDFVSYDNSDKSSEICDKKNQVLFTDTECLVLSKDFKLLDARMVVLKVPRKHNLYTINLNDLCPRAIRTAYYVLNRVLVTSPHNKTPYALLTGNIPSVSHFKPFGCHVTILNISDHLGKFDGKAEEGYIVGYSASNKAYKVYNVPNKRVEESMIVWFFEAKPNVQGLGTHDADSDSNCDEQVIIVPSYPSYNIQHSEPKDTSDDKVDDSPFPFADDIFQKELARLKGQEQRVTSDAKSLGLGFSNNVEESTTQASAKPILPGCIPVYTGSVPVPTGSIQVPTSDIPVPIGGTMVSTDDVSVHTSSSTDSIFDGESTTRFSYLSDLRNHDSSPGIFSSSSYNDEFGATPHNVASTVEVSLVATKRINTIHP